jgi:hypothetical protein
MSLFSFMTSRMSVTNHNIIKIRTWNGYISIAVAFKNDINSQNNNFVFDYEQPESMSTNY